MSQVLLAFDCGLANTGWCALSIDGFTVQCVGLGVIRTEKSNAKRNVLAADDTTRRVRELAAAIIGLLAKHRPTVLASESMSFPRHASSAVKLGMARAVVDTIAEVRGLPVLQASPQEVKKYVTGKASASKEEVGHSVQARLGVLQLPSQRGLHEHCLDAAAVGLTCLQSDVIRALRGAA